MRIEALEGMLTAPPPITLPPPSPPPWFLDPSPPPPTYGEGVKGGARAIHGPPITVTSNDLTYRGEGADHVVLGLKKMGRVLRLRKTCVRGGGRCSREELLDQAMKDQEVLTRVGRVLLGRLLTDAAHLLLVTPHPHTALSDALRPWRRGHREDKEINRHGIACMCPDATTIFIPRQDNTPAQNVTPTVPNVTPALRIPPAQNVPPVQNDPAAQSIPVLPNAHSVYPTPRQDNTPALDVSLSPSTPSPASPRGVEAGVGVSLPLHYPREASTVCIEIKPKQGFLDTSTPGLPLCRYCVKQFLKVDSDEGRSGYCPLDLFSGCEDRMRRAVDSLIASPQNNFKVFVDGQPMDEARPFQFLRDIIIAALTYNFTSGHDTASGQLSDRSPLGRILAFQKLDRIGVFRASQLYVNLCDLLGDPEAVNKALSDLSAWVPPSVDLTVMEEERGDEAEMVRLLQNYLLSITAKDISLMILLSGPYYSPVPPCPPNTSPFPVVGRGGAWFRCQVTGVDIVAKPTSKILKHQRDYERLRDVLVGLKGCGEEPGCCRV